MPAHEADGMVCEMAPGDAQPVRAAAGGEDRARSRGDRAATDGESRAAEFAAGHGGRAADRSAARASGADCADTATVVVADRGDAGDRSGAAGAASRARRAGA